jgi:hypothetical protein
MYAHHFMRLQRHHSPGIHGQRKEISAETYAKTQKGVETVNQLCLLVKRADVLQRDNARHHTSAAT